MGRQLRSNMRRLAKGLEEREQWEKGLDACSTFELWMLVFFSFGTNPCSAKQIISENSVEWYPLLKAGQKGAGCGMRPLQSCIM